MIDKEIDNAIQEIAGIVLKEKPASGEAERIFNIWGQNKEHVSAKEAEILLCSIKNLEQAEPKCIELLFQKQDILS